MMQERKKSIISVIVAMILCLNSVCTLWVGDNTVSLAADAVKVEDVNYEMKYGASVRYATTAEESGLRFAATMPKAQYESLRESGYAELKFGVMIMPYNYLEKYGDFTVDNLFGANAVYDWATQDENGEWIYNGTKTRIINIVSDKMVLDENDSNLYVMNGSIVGILENNLARDFVGIGYIQYKVNETDGYSYRLADYAEGVIHNNVRSIVEVAEATYDSTDASVTEENKALVKKFYIDATDVRCVKFYDNNELLKIHKSFTEYLFDGVPLAKNEEGYEFAYWVDKNGNQVDIVKDATEVTKTMKLYAVYKANGLDYVAEGYLGENGKIMTAIREFVAMDVTKANIADAQGKYEEVKEYLGIPRASEYNALIDVDTRKAINDKIADINTVLKDSDDLYETYTAVVTDVATTSVAASASATIPFPCINYSLIQSASFEWSTSGWMHAGYGEDLWYYDNETALGGTVTIANNGDGTLTVTMAETQNSKGIQSVTITDADIVNGNKPLIFAVLNQADWMANTFTVGAITITSFYDLTGVEGSEILYTGQNLIDNTSVVDGSGNAPHSESASSLIDGGVNYDCSGTGDTNWTISLPKVNYGAYEKVSMSFQATSNWQTIGFVDGGRIADGGEGALAGTITITNNGDGTLTAEITTTSPSANTVTYTFTDSDMINGTKSLPIFWNNGATYRQMSIGPISGTSRVSATSVEKIDVADKALALEEPYYEVAGKTLFAGESLIAGVACSNANVKIESNDEFFPNAVQFEPGSAQAEAIISLPRINYAECEKVTMQFKGRNAYQSFGFSKDNRIWDSGEDSTPFDGIITIVTNADGTLTGTITDNTTGNTVSQRIEDTTIINGDTPLTFYWDSGAAYRQILIGPISCDTKGSVTTSPPKTPYTIVDFNKSTYEVSAVDMQDESRDILIRRDVEDNTKLYIETQDSSASGVTKMYAVELPWIAYNKYYTVSTTISSNNGHAGLAEDKAFHDTNPGLELTMTYADGKLTVTLGDSVEECTDADVLNGRKGLTIYIQGSQYTMSYLSAFNARGKTSPVSSGNRAQALDLAKVSGSTNVSEYRIAYDADGAYNDADYYKWIANEMKLFLEEMSGITFYTVGIHDASVISNTSKYIVIGERLANAMGLETFDLTQTNGYNVKQDYKNLYIYGGSPRGTMSGVYGFLKESTGLTFYTDKVYTHDYTDTSLQIDSGQADFFNPSFNIGITGYAEAQYSKEYNRRLGLSNDGYIGTGANPDADANGTKETLGTHCMLEILPYDTYGSTYPEWYVKDQDGIWQLDFSNDSRAEMLENVVASTKEAIEAFPNHDYFVFGQPDGQYGPDVTEYLAFMNDCSQEIERWMQEEGYTRTVSLCMLAYNGTLQAPASGSFYNGACAKTAVIFAPVGTRYTAFLGAADSYHKNTAEGEWDESKKTIKGYLEEWKALEGANIHFWLYGTDFYNYMMPMDSITNMKANYEFALAAGTDAIHFQLQTAPLSSVGSDWQRLKTYLSAELTKNVGEMTDDDFAALQDNFMNAMYGAGAEDMKGLLEAQQKYVTIDNFKTKDETFIGISTNYAENYFGLINGSNKLFDSGYFKKDDLVTWMGYIEEAKAAINADTSLNDAEKAMYLENVDVEALSIRYMLIELHGVTTYDANVATWKENAAALGCHMLSETDNF